jgi:glycosyltransferase involved in cell wall biosynthesis
MLKEDLKEKKNLLIITDLFPPAGGAGVQYVLKLIKYLRIFNWQPIILTVKTNDFWIIDRTLEKHIDFSALRIYRVSSFKLPRFDQIEVNDRNNDKNIYKKKRESLKRILDPVLRFLNSYLFIPDKRVSWIPFAYFKAKNILRYEKIDVIFTISPAFSTSLVGTMLKKRFGKPLVSYFLDPWTDNPYNVSPLLNKFVNSKLERWLMTYVDRAIFCTRRFADYISFKYPLYKEKISYIPIGFDPEDFKDVDLQGKLDKHRLIITYTGTFYGHRNPHVFLNALALLLEKKPELRSKINVKFIGASKIDLTETVEKLNLKDVIEIIDYVPWKTAITFLRSSDVLLLIVGEYDDIFVPGKLYEYLGIKKFILGIGSEGEAKEIIEKSNSGVFFRNDQIEELSDFIYKLYFLKSKGEVKINPNIEYISQFYSQNCIKRLTEIFNEILNEQENKL